MNHSFDNLIVPVLSQRNLHLSVEYVKLQGFKGFKDLFINGKRGYFYVAPGGVFI